MSELSMRQLYHFLLLHGYNTQLEKYELDEGIHDYAKELSQVDCTPFQGYDLSYLSKYKMKTNAKRFMHEKFSLHPVGFLTNARLKGILRDKNIQTIEDIAPIYNQSAIMVDPFKIPLRYDHNSIFGGTLVAQNVIPDDESAYTELLPLLNIYFTHIRMPKVITEVTPTSYVHEITHTQLESHKGIIDNYYNGELLSTFMELLHSYETNPQVFTIDLVNRIQNVLVNFYSMFIFNAGKKNPERDYSISDYFSDSQYLISILKAFQLFHIYENSDISLRNVILKGIQAVFDGDLLLEEFLDTLGITYESSLNPEYPLSFLKKK